MHNFTKGPWTVRYASRAGPIVIESASLERDRKRICRISLDVDADGATANAYLIAAAPSLYLACLYALEKMPRTASTETAIEMLTMALETAARGAANERNDT